MKQESSKIKLKLLTNTPNPERVIACAAKLCYSPVGVDGISEKMTDEEVSKFIGNLASMGHESPLEHVTFTFAIEGISRACSHQLVRHRIASFSQQSQRYVKEDNFDYIIPNDIKSNSIATQIFESHMAHSQLAYDNLVDILIAEYSNEKGYYDEYEAYYNNINKDTEPLMFNDFVKKNHKDEYKGFVKRAIENARYVFPNATETKLVFTMNIRSLYNFLTLRCCDRAQEEIRDVANLMLKELRAVSPTLFKKAGPSCVRGNCKEGSLKCSK